MPREIWRRRIRKIVFWFVSLASNATATLYFVCHKQIVLLFQYGAIFHILYNLMKIHLYDFYCGRRILDRVVIGGRMYGISYIDLRAYLLISDAFEPQAQSFLEFLLLKLYINDFHYILSRTSTKGLERCRYRAFFQSSYPI